MAETEVKILSLQLDYQNTVEGLVRYEKQIEQAKKGVKEMTEEMKNSNEVTDEQREALINAKTWLKQLQTEQAQLQKSLQNQVKAERAENGSLQELRAQLSALTQQYDSLSQDVRDSTTGVELQQRIKGMTDELKDAEEKTGRYFRNVGNYTESIKKAFEGLDKELDNLKNQYAKVAAAEGEDSKAAKDLANEIKAQEQAINATRAASQKLYSSVIPFADKLLPILGGGLKSVKAFFVQAADGAKILGKQLAALMANPIVAFLAAIAAAIALVVAGVKGSEENTNKLNKILVPLKSLLGFLQGLLEKICGWILTGVEYAGKLAAVLAKVASTLVRLIPLVGNTFADAIDNATEAVKHNIEVEERAQQLEKDKRDLLIAEAKTQNEVAKLRDKASDSTQKYADRIEALKQAIKAEEEIAVERVRLAKEELAIAQEQAKQAPNSAEDNKRLAELEANVYNAEKVLYEQRRNLNKQLNTLTAAEVKEREEAAAKRIKAAEDAAKKERELLKQAEDAMIKQISDNTERQLAEINTRYDREIAELQKRLDEEKDLTIEAQNAINKIIVAKEQERAKEVAAVEKEQTEKAKAEEVQRLENDYRERLNRAAKNAVEVANIELQYQRDKLARMQQQEGESAEQFRARVIEQQQAITNAEQQGESARKAEREKAAKEEAQRLANEYTERLMQAQDNEVERARIELEQKEQSLNNLHQMEEESDAEFRARQLEAQSQYVEAQKRLAEKEIQIHQAKAQMVASLAGGFSKAIGAMGESNREFAKLSKVLALGEIAVNTGKAIAAGTAQAQSVPYPANLVAIATTIASVMANIATAITTVKSAKFATGGVNIQGAGSGTSDSIFARISSGESVINAAATAMFADELRAMNAIGAQATPQLGGVTMNNAEPTLFADSVKSALEDVHPIVSVVDIADAQKRVDVIDRLAQL